jgi:hypothetical protein
MAREATITRTILTGQAAKLLTVSGVITTPSWMPITAKQTRPSDAGTLTGRRSNAATATARTDPQIHPAGNPISVNAAPPASAMMSVSAVSVSVRSAGGAVDIELPHACCRLRRQTRLEATRATRE